VVDYTEYTDAEDVVRRLAASGPFDIVFDCARSLPAGAARRLLASKGEAMLLSTEGKIWKFFSANLTQVLPGRRTWALLAHPDGRRLERLVPLFEEEKLRVVTSSRYPLARAADALRESMEGHATGKIIVEV
jgi:NADPH:quinone reductase-like Zn-dependent oxidoreductase